MSFAHWRAPIVTSKPIHHAQEILGYTLDERIGAGGFGEVWSATAPGGMKKALKIVYGFHDEKRAQAELKALDRVKTVRHPFLLSLERIEVFEGQLIVVSELADKSLADLFNEYATKGEPGIPRDDLLKFISNTADALDYLASEFSLQHLDVKPENLLVVSGHVKVADFGLMKDLRAESQSLMQGMSPAYAAPELFDGQPSPKSDQYSLAIVYQEMLTGVRPFPGTTPAQLAAQHMHGKPNLRPLPRSDQAAIARALSKDPGVRYLSCVEMVADLQMQRRTVRKALKRASTIRETDKTDLKTAIVGDGDSILRDVTEMVSGGLPFQPNEIATIGPPVCDESEAVCRPTLIVSVGSTANKITQKIKSSLNSRLGSVYNVPAVQLICIDSDRNDLTQLTMRGDNSIESSEIISTPVRKAEDYRAKTQNLKWLGRRWIYNVPRTLQTEGLRPLGRLVFADHFEAICERLDTAVKELAKPENLAKTSDALGISPGEVQKPRIYLVSSISGGIGSGMVLDLAYTIRLLLAENGMDSSGLHGMLLHSSYQRNRDPGLSAANAFAFLTEMRHFNDNGYPGDDSLGIPEFDDVPPFEHTYFAELGHDLNQSQLNMRLNEVAEYISLSSMSTCSAFFDACHKFEKEEIDHFALRTFGLSVTGPGTEESGTRAINRLGSGLINRWINGDPANPFDSDGATDRLLRKHNLSKDTILQSMDGITDSLSETNLEEQKDQVVELVKSNPENLIVRLVEKLDSFYGRPQSRIDSSFEEPKLCVSIEELITSEAIKDGASLNEDINVLLDGNTICISDVNATVDGTRRRFIDWSDAMAAQMQELEQQTAQAIKYINQICNESKLNDNSLQMLSEAINSLCSVRRSEFVLRYSRLFLRVLASSLESAKVTATNLRRSLDFVMTEFAYEETLPAFDADFLDMDQLLSLSIHQDVDNQIKKLEVQIYESLIKDMGGFEPALTESSCWQRKLPNEIRTMAQRILADAYEKISIEDVIEKNGVAPEQLIQWLNSKIKGAKPNASDCGGESRMLIGLPKYSTGNRIPDLVANNFHVENKAIHGTSGNMVLCFEGENLSLAAVAFRLLAARPDAVELVKRIHTRNDVEWSTLNDLL
jgi:serine/threonine protein kinase